MNTPSHEERFLMSIAACLESRMVLEGKSLEEAAESMCIGKDLMKKAAPYVKTKEKRKPLTKN